MVYIYCASHARTLESPWSAGMFTNVRAFHSFIIYFHMPLILASACFSEDSWNLPRYFQTWKYPWLHSQVFTTRAALCMHTDIIPEKRRHRYACIPLPWRSSTRGPYACRVWTSIIENALRSSTLFCRTAKLQYMRWWVNRKKNVKFRVREEQTYKLSPEWFWECRMSIATAGMMGLPLDAGYP